VATVIVSLSFSDAATSTPWGNMPGMAMATAMGMGWGVREVPLNEARTEILRAFVRCDRTRTHTHTHCLCFQQPGCLCQALTARRWGVVWGVRRCEPLWRACEGATTALLRRLNARLQTQVGFNREQIALALGL
jgi:hypothetical protein